MSSFDGESFAGNILLIIVIALLIFGSTDIEDLTGAPSSS
ncbi:Sec-independent protein translocase protein TatA [Paenibacillus forsythiae]|uniref:Sec-independent protein translocase protein TatA n=1 Tax=Paenibacillus forsythiae TaxID=365616 RepID=A0ABU3H8V8_9BACL|nr:Sec-independent protein translocase protein TatA [Paenibacillus forsythiae]